MASSDVLGAILQTLQKDSDIVAKLPSVLNALLSPQIDISSSLNRWTSRVDSLIHSKEYGARWAGIILALETARRSRSVLLDSGQGWVTAVLPSLSKNEGVLVWKAGIRLTAYIFTSTMGLAEFQRQVVLPNVPKLSTALLSLAEKRIDEKLTILCLDTLRMVVSLFPTLHRPIASTLSSISLTFINGTPSSTPSSIMKSASRLHACLHVTGGKVVGPSLWRKSVDETVPFCLTAVRALRSTFISEGEYLAPTPADPLELASLNLDRLHCGIELLCSLLRETMSRPVVAPVSSLANLCLELMSVTSINPLPSGADSATRSIESSVIPSVLQLGCRLANDLCSCIQSSIVPHFGSLISIMAYQLERSSPVENRIPFIKLIPTLFTACPSPSDPLIVGRVLKAILPGLAFLLSQKGSNIKIESASEGNSKKGKKRARDFESDEIFRAGQDALCSSSVDGELVLASLKALPYLLHTPKLPAYLESLSSRLLLSLLIAIPKLSWVSVSRDPTLKDAILREVKNSCLELTVSSSSILSKSVPLVIEAISDSEMHKKDALFIDLLIHPRAPPVLRPLPPIDTIALRQSEESVEERKLRSALGLRDVEGDTEIDNRDVEIVTAMQVSVDAQPTFRPTAQPSTRHEPAPVPFTITPVYDQPPVVTGMTSSGSLPIIAPASVPMVASPSEVQDAIPMVEDPPLQNMPIAVEQSESSHIHFLEDDQRAIQTQSTKSTERDVPLNDPKASPSIPREPTRIVADDDDDDDDEELPTIDPSSDTESVVDSD